MVKSWIEGNIVNLEIHGEFLADELYNETNKWLESHRDQFVGYLVDISHMTKQTALEQKKAEDYAKKNKSGKLRAVIGKDAASAMLINIYMRFTGAEGIKYFTQKQDALTWLGFKN